MNLLDAFLELLYPPRCIICDEPILDDGYCKNCKGKIVSIPEDACCGCGLEKKDCGCKFTVYHFDRMTAPFYNEGYAQQAVYNLKFSEKFNCVKVFGDEMAKRVDKVFGTENIDVVCCVPSSKKSLLYRGFNQSELFTNRIAKTLSLKLDASLLYKMENVKTQHGLKTKQQRFLNVRDKYGVNGDVKGKDILLVDDIKTTGASLDECARQLKFAGAETVYCVTALVSKKRKTENITEDLKK